MPRKPRRRASAVRRRVSSSFQAVPYRKGGAETSSVSRGRVGMSLLPYSGRVTPALRRSLVRTPYRWPPGYKGPGAVGNEARTAHDGQEAVEAAASFRPGLILMDIGMPRLNGYDACRRIRGEPWGRGVVVVALTGWGQEED